MWPPQPGVRPSAPAPSGTSTWPRCSRSTSTRRPPATPPTAGAVTPSPPSAAGRPAALPTVGSHPTPPAPASWCRRCPRGRATGRAATPSRRPTGASRVRGAPAASCRPAPASTSSSPTTRPRPTRLVPPSATRAGWSGRVLLGLVDVLEAAEDVGVVFGGLGPVVHDERPLGAAVVAAQGGHGEHGVGV